MKVVLAFDSFKGTLSALDACKSVQRGILSVNPDSEVVICPMADGGEGTIKALMAARGGEWIQQRVMGPLPDRRVHAGFAWFADDRTAAVEMAEASGITLLRSSELNPMRTTTYGTGELMRAAVERGARRIILAIGGSATVDGGIGAAMALGWTFLTATGEPVGFGGEALQHIQTVQPGPELGIPVDVLCDVANPLTGPKGAAAVFGPQKGATPEMVQQLDEGLRHWAAIARDQLGVEIETIPGAGAAGGLGAGMMACASATLVPGIDTVMTVSRLDEKLTGADWVLSGEGRFDESSLGGKVVSGILSSAKQAGVRMGVLAGSMQVEEQVVANAGIEVAMAAAAPEKSFEEIQRTASSDLEQAAVKFAQTYLQEGA